MIFGSVCSGIEAASVAWHPLGWRAAFLSEIEAFPSAVLAHHYPDVPNLGDMTRFMEWPDANLDVLVGGTPCQSFSVAGLRKGLDDPRGNLMLTYGAIAGRYRPRWLVWENVPGVLSSNGGRDFGAFLGMLVELGYGFAYRVLNAQYFGIPQRRRRVFVVGCLGGWRSAAAVLFERHCMQGNPAPSREARQVVAGTIAAGTGGSDENDAADGRLIPWPAEVACTLNAAFGSKQGLEDQHALGGGNCSFPPRLSLCLNAGAMGRLDAESETLIPTFGGGFDAAPIAFGWQNSSHQGDSASEDVTPTLDKSKTPAVAVRVMPFDTTQVTSPHDRARPDWGREFHTLSKGAHAPAIAIQAGALRTNPDSGPNGAGVREGVAYTIEARAEVQAVAHLMAVRRLTPTECERLQGFPDGYTDIKPKGKPTPDGPRYKALGNSFAVPVVRWIGDRIAAVDAIEHKQAAA